MCDKAHFEELQSRVDNLEIQFVKHASASDVKFETLLKASTRMFWASCIFGLILLLAVVYGAVGERGFNHVACAAEKLVPNPGK